MKTLGTTIPLGLVLIVLSVSCGCTPHSRPYGEIVFSPDGDTVAFIWEDSWEMRLLHVGTPLRSLHLRWCDASDPRSQRSVRLDSLGWKFSHSSVPVELRFSPDSRHVAAWTAHFLTVVDLSSGRQWRLARFGERVTSFAWLSDHEVGYVTHTNLRGRFGRIADRTFWRQNIHKKLDARIRIFRETGAAVGARPTVYDYPIEHWSPKGRYVIFTSSRFGRFHLLNVADRTERVLGGTDAYLPGDVSWTPDGSKVFCIIHIYTRSPNGSIGAFLAEAATGKTLDCTAQFAKVFGNDRFRSSYRLEPVWTCDGRYVLLNNFRHGGYLIQPQPWRAIAVGRQAAKQLRDKYTHPPWVFRLPFPGWVGFGFPPKGPEYDDPGYATDYQTRKLLPLPVGPGSALSPRGRFATFIGGAGDPKHLIIGRLDMAEFGQTLPEE